jgi:hypothetical protein
VQAEGKLAVAECQRQLRAVEAELAAGEVSLRRSAERGVNNQQHIAMNGWRGGGGLPRTMSLMEGGAVDVDQLRNALFGLLGAVAAGQSQKRDALLPVVGMLVGASPQECKELQQRLSGTSSSMLPQFWPIAG